jgi:hypothetical protein
VGGFRIVILSEGEAEVEGPHRSPPCHPERRRSRSKALCALAETKAKNLKRYAFSSFVILSAPFRHSERKRKRRILNVRQFFEILRYAQYDKKPMGSFVVPKARSALLRSG